MKLEFPDNHPIAEAIREATREAWNDRLILSLDALGPKGHRRLFALEIDQWTLTTNTETKMECRLTDVEARRQEIEALTQWPEPPEATDPR